MPWAKLDDGFHSHPKVMRVGNAAAGCYCRCLAFSAAYHTDGFIGDDTAKLFGAKSEYRKLVEAGMMLRVIQGESEVVDGRRDTGNRRLEDVTVEFDRDGYFIPDFLHYNRTKDETEAHRAARVAGGAAPAKGKQTRSRRRANAQHQSVLPTQPLEALGSNEPNFRNQLWDALTEVFGQAATESAKSLRGKIVRSLLGAGATPQEIRDSKAAWRKKMPPDTTFTETALEKHWGFLFRVGNPNVCAECGMGGGHHIDGCSRTATDADVHSLMKEIHAKAG